MLKPEQEMMIYEWYARHIWPIHRLFLRSTLTPRCTNCILPHTCSPLSNGVCELCRNHTIPHAGPDPETRVRMVAEINAIFEQYGGKGKNQFDCLLLFSGGKDSIYLLHTLKKRFPKLRILLLLVDNTFLPPNALSNASSVASKLRAPYIIIRPNPAFYEKVFRHAFLNVGTRESAVVVDLFDGDILHDIARNYAVRHAIPLIVSGTQAVQVERYVGVYNYETTREFEENRRTHVADIQLDSFLTKDDLAYFWDGTKWPKKSIPRMLYPFYAWDYEERDVVKTIEKLGLLPRKRLSPLATNHQLLPLMGTVDITHLGYSSYDSEFANLIRAGSADKKFWRAILEMQEYAVRKNKFINHSVNSVLTRLSLTRKELRLKE